MILHEKRLAGVDIRVVACIESLAEKVKKIMNRNLIIVFGYRSIDEQNRLYEQGRSIPGAIVTNARGGKSPHNYYCAIDCWVMNTDGLSIDWNNSTYKNMAREHALTVADKIQWGGDFKSLVDMPHWELRKWRAVRDGVEKVIPNTI